ncbi:hypothetical protein THASP1DRAFT_32909 [Thamnocephalis sphaerospora]|uniref:Fe2OG dioxygenase domain-containing protein n=1 Tax=Thamnocephalis sphaerospora TaxID=78915 RepID=A0A4P9XHS2_9FUNG|nr:hypothetical protein THASP1DRAFT_32909 [Thamnocephalis sphaerospora]|eukprot:RKP05254.1 hypothetical protein THASP1DRAFT_32909 [Thamnocephalis sphaerospora]
MTATSLPVVDFGAYLNPESSPEQRHAVACALDEACCNLGCFYLINHGVPQELCDAVRDYGRQFFQLSMEEKRRHSVSSVFRGYLHFDDEFAKGKMHQCEKIGFYPPVNCYCAGNASDADATLPSAMPPTAPDVLGDQDSWPSNEFRAVTEEYQRHMMRLHEHLFEAVANGLGIDEAERRWMKHPVLSTQFTWYQALTEEDTKEDRVSMVPHADPCCFTFLNQDHEAESHQMLGCGGRWYSIKPLPGAFIVSTGSVFNLWTSDRYPETMRRVIHLSKEPLISVATFIEPSFDNVVKPLPEFAKFRNPAEYTPSMYGSHVLDVLNDYIDW